MVGTMKRKIFKNPEQLSLFNASLYERQITEASIDCDGWEQKSTPVARESVERVYFLDKEVSGETTPPLNEKSTPVARESVQRVYFWVETYLMRQRYLHYRFCHIRNIDGISHVVKVHIPGNSRSVRKGRMHLVKEAIAAGKTPDEIEQLIRGWRA